MFRATNPIPGYWYSTHANRLIQVRAKLYVKGVLNCIVLEGLDSPRQYVKPADWLKMELILHSPVVTERTA